ncbi:MAG: hypothetical protein LBT53_05750 [Puniceicoccales bacterium]|jgi:hypothetical protein|nr:hypothetical protein [Puniceicoccales bacterium]
MFRPTQLLRSAFAAALACTAALFAGCSSDPVAFDVKITVDKALEGTAMQVDIFGVNKTVELPKWEAFPIADYWQPGNTSRRDLDRHTLTFGRKLPTTQTFPASDPKWSNWLTAGAVSAVVIADIPGVAGSGTSDPRRLILPLLKSDWDRDDSDAPLEIRIKESGLILVTRRTQK